MTEAPLSCVRLPLAPYKEGGRRHLTHNGHSSIDVDPTQNGPLPHTLDAAPSSHRDGGRETKGGGSCQGGKPLRLQKTPHRDHLTESRHPCTALPSQKDTAPCGPMLPGHPTFFEPLLSLLTSFKKGICPVLGSPSHLAGQTDNKSNPSVQNGPC